MVSHTAAESARVSIAGIQKLRAQGRLTDSAAKKEIAKHEAIIHAQQQKQLQDEQQHQQQVSTGPSYDDHLESANMSGKLRSSIPRTAGDGHKAATLDNNTTASRRVPTASQSSSLSAEAKPFASSNYTTDKPAVKGWGTEEQLASARAERDAMLCSGGRHAAFRRPPLSSFQRTVTSEGSAKRGIDESTSSPPASAKRRARRPDIEHYIIPPLRHAREAIKNGNIESSWGRLSRTSSTVTSGTEHSKEPRKVTFCPPEIFPPPTATKSAEKKFAGREKLTPTLAGGGKAKAVTSGSHAGNMHLMDSMNKAFSQSKPAVNAKPAIGKPEHYDESTTENKFLSVISQQQNIIDQQKALLEKQQAITAKLLSSQKVTAGNPGEQEQTDLKKFKDFMSKCQERIDEHRDRLINLESLVEVYTALGTANTKTPFTVKVEYPDKSMERIQTFGDMQISSLLERIMRRKQMTMDNSVSLAILTYLGEQLGHASFVAEHDIKEDSVLYFSYTREE